MVAHLSLQDIFLPPSRITIADLCRKYHLPSAISKYEKLHVPDKEGTSAQIGVHYLKYSRDETKGPPLLDAVYVHHGFGASSLSWLPALPSLVHRLGARVGLGHDMVGFGLTDRQNTLEWYTTDASARISSAVFVKETDHVNPVKAVALLGHSLGAIGVLKMALQLPKETFKSIILCSPALGFGSSFAKEWKEEEQAPGPLRDLGRVLGSFFRRCIFFPFGGYALRRIVG